MSALDDLRKKYNLESEEYYSKLSKQLEGKKYNKKTEAKNYASQYRKEQNTLNQYQNTMQQEQRKLGIKSANELIQESWQEKTKLPVKTLDEIVNIPTKNDFEKFKDNQNKIDSYNNSNTKKEYDELQNQNKYTRYMKDLSEIDLENTTFSDKINIINQFLAGLEGATSIGDYKDEKGNLIKLPSRSQLKAQKTSQDSEFIFKAIQSAANSLGAMTPAMIAGLTGIPGLSEAVTYATTLNSAYNEKVLEGYSKEQARNYGLINAGLETFLGKVLGGTSKILTGKESVLSNSLGKLTDKLFNNKGLSYFISHLTSEEIEENLQTILDPINEYITLGKYDTIGEALSNISGEDIALTALSTLITIGVTEGPTAITKSRIDKINKQYNTDIELKANENSLAEVVLNNNKEEKNTNESIRVEEPNKENNVNISNTVNEIQQQVEEIATGLSSETITNSVAQEQLIELQNGLTVLQRYNEQQSNTLTTETLDRQNQEISILSSQINELQQAMGINQTPQLQQIEEQKTAFSMPINNIEKGNTYTSKVNNQEVEFNVLDVANDKALIEITKSTLPTQQTGLKVTTSLNSPLIQNVVQPIDYINNVKYTPEIQKSINELVSTANTYLNKTPKANDIVKLLQKIIVDKGYSVRFNPNITNEQGVAVNGLIRKENGTTTIELNPNADNYVEFLIVHEITHDIATEEMKELILDYAKQDPNFNNALESLKERYNTDDVTDEVVADVCAELFGNKEFIQSVAEKKPSLFKKILNNIRKLAEKIKGTGANEYVSFVEKLKTMWEDAYYSNRSDLSKTMYHLSENALNEVIDTLDNPNTDADTMVKLRDFTPKQLVSVGVSDLPMLVRKGHLRENILTGVEAKNKGYSTKGKHYHGLGIDTYMNAIDSLDNPIAVYQYTDKGKYSKDNFIVLTEVKDSNNNNIIVPIEIHKKGQYNKVEIDTNRIKTTYGRETTNYFNNMIENGNLVEIYNKKRNTKLPMQSGNLNVSDANNIPQSDNNVNSDTSSTTKYFIPINKNNAQIKGLDYAIDHLNRSIELDNEIAKNKKEELNEKIKEWYDRELEFYKEAVNDGDIPEKNLKEFLEHFENGNNISYYEVKFWQQMYNDEIEPFEGFDALVKEIEELEYSEDDNSNQNKILSALNETIDYLLKYFPKDKIEVDYSTQSNSIYVTVQGNEDTYTLRISDHHTPHYSYQGQWHDINNTWEHRVADDYDRKASQSLEEDLEEFLDIIKEEEGNLPQFSQNVKEWNDYLKENFPSSGTKTKMSEIKAPIRDDIEVYSKKNKTLNPNEISKLTPEDANTTPLIPIRKTYNKISDGDSHFVKNINEKTDMLTEEQKDILVLERDINSYDKVTNKESLEKAYNKLQKNGQNEVMRWLNQESETFDSIDVAEGWILLKQYADNNNVDCMVEVAKKLRNLGTKAGQAVQAFNIMERMTPEGMVKYAQSELMTAYDKMVKNKTKDWIDKYKDDFDLKPNEVQFILDTMKEINKTTDGYERRVKLAEIQKIMTDKLPPERGAGIKAWMRISMLFNPKTQGRNILGNAVIAPTNAFSDLFASGVDKLISKKTGVRTVGTTDFKSYGKGFKTGLYQSYNDFKKGINTRNIEGNRFEISQGKSFNNKTSLGKALNKVDSLLSFMLDAGDRGFYEASFTNSINNQLVLNNTDIITQEMIDIATQEALSRTWQDNNNYTKFVLQTRNLLNKINVKGYGLGDTLIPFAKTPANLTKAIVDYSPAGLIGTINSGINLKRALNNGQYTSSMQHEFVQNLGKATAGTILYILGIALAKAGITSGESDDDKDTANFLKNTLGVSSYSIKIGNKSFTYDWAQPIAAPLSITANLVQKEKQNASLYENILGSLDTAGNILLEQSFLESLNTVFNNSDGVATGIQKAILDLPARAIPTFSKQIADLIDGTQRTSFEYDKPLKSSINSVAAKIPILSKTLNPSVDTLGREIQKYGGKNNLFNVFLNPANVNTENISKSAEEIYRLYKETGDKNIMPRVAPYYINQKGEKIVLSSKERTEYQKVSGQIIETCVDKLLSNKNYVNLNDTEKADVINNIVNYSYNMAKKEVLNFELSNEYKKANLYSKVINIGDYYVIKTQSFTSDKNSKGETIRNSKKNKEIKYVNSLKLSIPQKAILIKMNYSSFDNYDDEIRKYIDSKNLTNKEKQELYKDLKL